MKNSDGGMGSLADSPVSRLPALPKPVGTLLAKGRFFHAVLLEGASAAGNRLTGSAIAGALLCTESRCGMCGRCKSCRQILDRSHPDLILLDPEEDPDCYRKNRIRNLRFEAWRKPVQGENKVVLFSRAEEMPAESQNLLLKLVEEPPENTFFIFCAENRYRLLPTILSRTVVFPLPPRSDEETLRELLSMAPGFTEADYGKAVIVASGSPRQGAAYLTDPAARGRYDAAERMMAGLAERSGYRVLAAAAPFERNRASYRALLEALSALLANEAMRRTYQMPSKRALPIRRLLMSMQDLCERNAYLPLVSALLTKRAGELY